MKYHSSESTFKNSWEQTIVAVWQRYPNPFSRHVLSEDILERKIIKDKNESESSRPRLFTKRLLIKTNPLPKWGQRFVNMRQVAVIEESILDRDRNLFITYTRNIGYTSTMNVIEKCIYTPSRSTTPVDDENSTKPATTTSSGTTLLKREAWINSQLRGFSTVLQRFGIERYKHNANMATKGLNYALAHLFPPQQQHQQHSSSTTMRSSSPTKLTTSAAYAVVHKIENATANVQAATNAASSSL